MMPSYVDRIQKKSWGSELLKDFSASSSDKPK